MTKTFVWLACVCLLIVFIGATLAENNSTESSESDSDESSEEEKNDTDDGEKKRADESSEEDDDDDTSEESSEEEKRKKSVEFEEEEEIGRDERDQDFDVKRSVNGCDKECNYKWRPFCGFASECEYQCEKRRDPSVRCAKPENA